MDSVFGDDIAMKGKESAAKGYRLNCIVGLINALILSALVPIFGKHIALSYLFGVLLAHFFSLSWFFLASHSFGGTNFIAIAIGGFLARAMMLITALYCALSFFSLSPAITTLSFLVVRIGLASYEILIFIRAAKV
jgi:hypothetical protein